jgi:hypothetical protein
MKNINDNVPYVLMSAFDISNYPEENGRIGTEILHEKTHAY